MMERHAKEVAVKVAVSPTSFELKVTGIRKRNTDARFE
jgi:hypothetical protein